MSLDARIRQLAAETLAETLAKTGGSTGTSPARVAELETLVADQQAQLRDLHDHLHRALTQLGQVAARVETLETGAATAHPTEQEAPPRRSGSRRKTES